MNLIVATILKLFLLQNLPEQALLRDGKIILKEGKQVLSAAECRDAALLDIMTGSMASFAALAYCPAEKSWKVFHRPDNAELLSELVSAGSGNIMALQPGDHQLMLWFDPDPEDGGGLLPSSGSMLYFLSASKSVRLGNFLIRGPVNDRRLIAELNDNWFLSPGEEKPAGFLLVPSAIPVQSGLTFADLDDFTYSSAAGAVFFSFRGAREFLVYRESGGSWFLSSPGKISWTKPEANALLDITVFPETGANRTVSTGNYFEIHVDGVKTGQSDSFSSGNGLRMHLKLPEGRHTLELIRFEAGTDGEYRRVNNIGQLPPISLDVEPEIRLIIRSRRNSRRAAVPQELYSVEFKARP